MISFHLLIKYDVHFVCIDSVRFIHTSCDWLECYAEDFAA